MQSVKEIEYNSFNLELRSKFETKNFDSKLKFKFNSVKIIFIHIFTGKKKMMMMRMKEAENILKEGMLPTILYVDHVHKAKVAHEHALDPFQNQNKNGSALILTDLGFYISLILETKQIFPAGQVLALTAAVVIEAAAIHAPVHAVHCQSSVNTGQWKHGAE